MNFPAALTLATAVAAGPSIDDARLLAEIDRLDALLTKTEAGLPEPVKDLPKIYREMLAKARQAKTPETRLYRMRAPFGGIEGLAYLREHEDAGKDLAAFTAFWNANRAHFEKKAPPPRGTFIEKALQDAATNRAEKLFNASLPYAKVDAASSGVYYVSEAEGSLRYRDFVREVATRDVDVKSPPGVQISRALDAMQGRAIQAFEKEPPTSRSMLAVSSKLKETRELLESRRLEAATLSLLESRYELSKRAPRAQSGEVAVPKSGDAVVTLWSEIAAIETPENGRLVRSEVLPLYESLWKPAVASLSQRPPVTVTLVRWPYT